jgi:hypothetical protein
LVPSLPEPVSPPDRPLRSVTRAPQRSLTPARIGAPAAAVEARFIITLVIITLAMATFGIVGIAARRPATIHARVAAAGARATAQIAAPIRRDLNLWARRALV